MHLNDRDQLKVVRQVVQLEVFQLVQQTHNHLDNHLDQLVMQVDFLQQVRFLPNQQMEDRVIHR